MSCDLTLLAFFDARYLPTYLVGCKPKTIRAYREALKHWSRVHGPTLLSHVNVEMLAAFKQALLERTQKPDRQRTFFDLGPPPLAVKLERTTINKHLRAIMAILAKAGPPGPRNRDALDLIPVAPWVKSLKVAKRLPRNVSAEDLAAMYEACGSARFPVLGIYSGAWWQALLVMAITSAFRRAALMALTWENIDLANSIVWLPAEFDKCETGRVKPLHSTAIHHLLKIRSGCPQVFPWPHGNKTYYQQWHAIQEAAGIPKERHFTLHDLKRTAGTLYAETANPWIVQQMLDHSSIQTSVHYVNICNNLREAVNRLPIPKVMLGQG